MTDAPKNGEFILISHSQGIDKAKWSDLGDGWACAYTGRKIRNPELWTHLPCPDDKVS